MISRFTVALLCIVCFFRPAQAQNQGIDHWESVVLAGDTWHYFVGLNAGPPSNWLTAGFDDGAWLQGPGGFGYSDGDDATVIPTPPNPYSVFTRIHFNILDTAQIGMAILNMDFDDGFVAWINGVEVARSNLGTAGDFPAYNTPATDHEAVMYTGQAPPYFSIAKSMLKACLVNGDNVLAIQVNNTSNTSSDMSCIAFLSVGMRSTGMTYRNLPDWFVSPTTRFTSSQLPLIIVRTNGSVIQQDYKIEAEVGIIDNGPGKLNHLSDPWNNFRGKAGIEIRGSSSTMFPKKNYGLELWDSNNQDTSFSLLGMPAQSDWILHGPYTDKSLIRNYLAYNLARDMGHYASRTRFCEMFINDEYQGVYVFLERIKRDSARVNISKLKTIDVTGDQLTGGYIVKIDRTGSDYSDGFFSSFMGTGTEGSSPFFAYVYPKPDVIVPVQKVYIQNKIFAFENTLHGNKYLDPYVGYKTFIDVSSFVDYFLIVEMSKNTDGYRLSTFLHKDRDGKDPRLHMGPIWDYDLAFGNANYLEAFNTYGWNYSVQSDGWGTPFWWQRMLTDPYFVNMLYCRWHEFRQGVLSDEALIARIDTAVAILGPAVTRNFDQWPIHGLYIWPNQFVGATYEEDIAYMKNWIIARAAWLDANIPGNTCISPVNEHEGTFTFLLRAYPNPAVEEINIEIQNEQRSQLLLEVFNFTGQLVYSKPIPGDIMLTERVRLNPGAYLVKVSGNGNSKSEKILIQ
jgi:hypothetical protein